MKRILCLLSIILLHYVANAQTQKKHDVVVKANGDELTGEVLEIGDSTVRFTYAGEKLVYNIKKSDIQKITYTSGRVENFAKSTPPASNASPAPAVQTVPDEQRHNKVAILPFTFLKDGQTTAQEVSAEVQNECYAFLSKHSGVYTVDDPRNTNVKLNRAGITKATIMNYTMDEICKVLGVEYVVDGMVSQNSTTQSTYGNVSYNAKVKDDNNIKSNSNKTTASASGSSYSSTSQNYQSTTDMKIYNDKGDVIYSQNRTSFWSDGDAYKSTIEYLLKRSPLYSK
jgi:hypothetical protein